MTLQKDLADKLNGKRMGNYYACWCPFDSHAKPALMIWKDWWQCYSCNIGGKLSELDYKLGHSIFSRPRMAGKSSQTNVLPRWRKWITKYGDLPGIADIAHKMLTPDKMGYLKSRKLEQFVEQGYFGILDGWLVLPVFSPEGEVLDIVVRAIRQKTDAKYAIIKKELSTSPRPLYVPNWERTLKNPYLFVVFGIITAWSMEALNQPVCTGITGKQLNPCLLDRFQKPIYIIPDVNEEKAAHKLCDSLGWRGAVLRVEWPSNCTDIDDIRNLYGEESLKVFLRSSLTKSRINITL